MMNALSLTLRKSGAGEQATTRCKARLDVELNEELELTQIVNAEKFWGKG